MSSTTTASASLLLNLKTPSFSKPTHTSLSVLSILNAKPLSISHSVALSSRFVRKSADISPDFGGAEEVEEEPSFSPDFGGAEVEEERSFSPDFGGEEEVEKDRSFSPDLKLFVGNLPFSVDSAQLAGLFEDAGNVQMVEVIYDKMTGRSRGFAFVTMSSLEEVEAAVQKFNGYELEGREIRVNNGPPPPKREFAPRGREFGARSINTNRLYVGNLSWDVDDSALASLFSEVGNVSEARVVCDRDSGRSRGFGFVSFSSAEEANNAIESLNGVELVGRSIRVSLAEDKPRRF